MPDAERQRENYRRWYKKHRQDYLADRRERTRSDPKFAAGRRASCNKYRAEHRGEINAERRERVASDPEYKASLTAHSETFRERIRSGHKPNVTPLYLDADGLQVAVYRQSESAREIGCSAAAIIKWIREGFIPEPYRENGRRLFTVDQIELIKLFYSISKHDHAARSECSKYIFENW